MPTTNSPIASRTTTTSLCSMNFFETLSDKLVCMVTSLKEQFDECHAAAVPQYEAGVVLVEIDVPKQSLGIKMEYIEYIKRYGPPTDGKFCEEKLKCLRIEMGIDNCNVCA